MPEREQGLLAVLVVPAVADEDSLLIESVASDTGILLDSGYRALLGGGRERQRETSTRICIPEEDRRYRCAELLARMERLQDGADLAEPRHQDRPAGVEHHHSPWIRGCDRGDQCVLVSRQCEGSSIHPFALSLTDEHNRDVAVGGQMRRV